LPAPDVLAERVRKIAATAYNPLASPLAAHHLVAPPTGPGNDAASVDSQASYERVVGSTPSR